MWIPDDAEEGFYELGRGGRLGRGCAEQCGVMISEEGNKFPVEVFRRKGYNDISMSIEKKKWLGVLPGTCRL